MQSDSISREMALGAVCGVLIGTGYQNRAMAAIRLIPALVDEEEKPVQYMSPCPHCGDPTVAVTGNEVSDDGMRGEIIQERTCESCGKKRYVRLVYRLVDVRPISEEELPKG